MNEWWSTAREGSRERVVLIQIDIGGHSAWLSKASALNYLDPCLERAKLPDQLERPLASKGYDRLFWAGDGGVYASKVGEDGHPHALCDAVDEIFLVFNRWRKGKNVEIRVSATLAEINISRDVGHWCGPSLNSFLKYERQIARPNAFVITQELRAALTGQSERSRFPEKKGYKVNLPNGDVITIFIDKRHAPKLVLSPRAFGPWLRDQIRSHNLPRSSDAERELQRVGQCTILDATSQISGYGEIDLEQQESVAPDSWLDDQDTDAWQTFRGELETHRVSGTSLQVTQFTSELSDDPHPRLKYRTIPYQDARAFHSLFEHNQDTIQRYRSRALDVLTTEGTNVPNILSTGIITLIETGGQSPKLVIANRKARRGGFHANTWAVSIGEQFMPVTGYRGDRKISADASLTSSIVRGLREELLGGEFNEYIRVSVHAFCLEDYTNNHIFMAIADLGQLTFEQLTDLWRGAVDRAEHDVIAAIPLRNKELLIECMREDRLPDHVWTTIKAQRLFAFGPGIESISEANHQWQPNSHVRLAIAYWYSLQYNKLTQ